MMPLLEAFSQSLAEFGEQLGIDLVLVDGHCNFIIDDTIEVEIDYFDDSHVVVAWATVGFAPEDEYQEGRACALLEMNDLNAPNGGFSLSMDPETRRVIVHDHRPVELFESADLLAVWIDALVDLVTHVRHDFEKRFPSADIPLDAEEGN